MSILFLCHCKRENTNKVMEDCFDFNEQNFCDTNWGGSFDEEHKCQQRAWRMATLRFLKKIHLREDDLPLCLAVLAFLAAALIALDFPTWLFFIPVGVYALTAILLKKRA